MKRKEINKIKSDILSEIEIYDFKEVKDKAYNENISQNLDYSKEYYKKGRVGYIATICFLSIIILFLGFDNLRLHNFYFPCIKDQTSEKAPYDKVLNYAKEEVNNFYCSYYIYETTYPFDKEVEEKICTANNITKEELFYVVYKTLLKNDYDKTKEIFEEKYKDKNINIVIERMDYVMRANYEKLREDWNTSLLFIFTNCLNLLYKKLKVVFKLLGKCVIIILKETKKD